MRGNEKKGGRDERGKENDGVKIVGGDRERMRDDGKLLGDADGNEESESNAGLQISE